ncbi:MAG: hypothetical protein PHO18_06730 [Synergistaceae bacterium]|nr:hypothetical protein [Synergistaceae bacterium]
MKRQLIFILTCILLSFASSSMAKPVAEEFRNTEYDYSSIKTVLIMPVMYEITIPDSEPFFDDSVQQKWKELTSQEKSGFSFLVKTPEQIIEREAFVKGTGTTEKMSRDKAAEKALSLSPEYADAIMTATVTKCKYTAVHHPQELIWDTRYENRSVYVNGKWENRSVPVSYQKIKPAWDESFAVGAVKLELRNSKDNTLIYGVNVNATTAEDLFAPLPTLTKHISNVLENAVKRVPKK